ncbi:hypothetical protein [Agromyces sp. Marseille-P2726]|uniref:hypothetical protein n=1 Tax=Agromyces sp. Marseille-P2726 TaxID=2709132 RepID=UPI00156EDDE1|nr:hypothetical protein [Agromyces sp. Marseille-P2726]
MTDSGPTHSDPESDADRAHGDLESGPPERETSDDRVIVRDPDTGHVTKEPTP